MPITNMIYIGNFADADTNEADWDSEIAGNFLGTYTASTGMSLTGLTTNLNNGQISYDNDNPAPGSGGTWSYDIGGGTVSAVQDTSEVYNSTVTYADGSTQTLYLAVVQMTNGDSFIYELSNNLDNSNITSIQLHTYVGSNYSGVYVVPGIEGSNVVCFVKGTLIETKNGHMPIESLKIGQLIKTRDRGYQALRWIGKKTVKGHGKLAPICIKKDTYGNTRDLWLSPLHRLPINSSKVEILFDKSEVLVMAKSLVDQRNVTQEECDEVTYYHILFDQHELVFSEGIWSESFNPGVDAIDTFSQDTKNEVLELFPKLAKNPLSYTQLPIKQLAYNEGLVLKGL